MAENEGIVKPSWTDHGFAPRGPTSVARSIFFFLPPSPPDLGFNCSHTELVFGENGLQPCPLVWLSRAFQAEKN